MLRNFQSTFCRSVSEEEEGWWYSRGSSNGHCRPEKRRRKGDFNGETASNRCAIKVPKDRVLYRNACNGSWEKPSNSGMIQKVAGVHQACSLLVRSWGLFDLVISCFPLVMSQIYPTELEMQLSNPIYTCYNL